MKRVAVFGLVVALESTFGIAAHAEEPRAQAQPQVQAQLQAEGSTRVELEGVHLQTTQTSIEKRSLVVPAVLAGVGVVVATVGVLLVVTAPDTPSGCNNDTQTCPRAPGATDADFSDQQDRAGRAHALPIAGWLTVGVGGMLAAAGVLSYVFGPVPKPRRNATLTPSLGASSGGLSATGTF